MKTNIWTGILTLFLTTTISFGQTGTITSSPGTILGSPLAVSPGAVTSVGRGSDPRRVPPPTPEVCPIQLNYEKPVMQLPATCPEPPQSCPNGSCDSIATTTTKPFGDYEFCAECEYKLKVTFSVTLPQQGKLLLQVNGAQWLYTSLETGCTTVQQDVTIETTFYGQRDAGKLYFSMDFLGGSHPAITATLKSIVIIGAPKSGTTTAQVQSLGTNSSTACATCPSSQNAVPPVGKVSLAIPLSGSETKVPDGHVGGQIVLNQSTPSASLAKPESLGLTRVEGMEVIRDSTNPTAIRQVLATDRLADIAPVDNYSYQVKIYSLDDVGTKQSGVYQTTGDPLQEITVQNPNGSTNFNTLNVIYETGPAAPITNQFVYVAAKQDWTVREGNGTTVQTSTTTWTENNTIKTTVSDINSTTSSTVVECVIDKYEVYSWGTPIIEAKLGLGTNQLTTSYSYWTNSSDNGYTQLKQMVLPTGDWRYYTYDTSGRVSRAYSTFGNQGHRGGDEFGQDDDYLPAGQGGREELLGSDGGLEKRNPMSMARGYLEQFQQPGDNDAVLHQRFSQQLGVQYPLSKWHIRTLPIRYEQHATNEYGLSRPT